MKPMKLTSKWQLSLALFAVGGIFVEVQDRATGVIVKGILMAVERESGCGSSFNLYIHEMGATKSTWVYWRSVD